MTTYRLGINTCFAVKRWPQPERWAALVRDELGLDLVQHCLDLVDLAFGDGDAEGGELPALFGVRPGTGVPQKRHVRAELLEQQGLMDGGRAG